MRKHRFLVAAVVAGALALAGMAPAGAFPVDPSFAGMGSGATCSTAGIALAVSNDVGTGNYVKFKITNGAGTVLTETAVSPTNAWDNYGPVPPDSPSGAGIGVNPVQPVGTLIGFYYTIGDGPTQTAPNTGEFFAAYTCGAADGESTQVYSCFGPLGTCPTNAADIPKAPVDPGVPAAAPIDLAPSFTG